MTRPQAGIRRLPYTILVLLLTQAPAAAHLGNLVTPVYELPTSELPDLHDGTLEDWEAVLPSSIDQNHFISPFGQQSSSLAWRVFLAWHSSTNRLLIGFESIDDVFVPDGKFTGDRFDISVDGDHSGGTYSDSDPDKRSAYMSSAQAYMTTFKQSHPDGIDAVTIRYFNQWPMSDEWADASISVVDDVPSQLVVEFSVSLWDVLAESGAGESRRHDLRANELIGLQMTVYDEDGGSGTQIHFLSDASGCTACGPDPFSSASSFVDAMLIPCQHSDCSGEPVVSAVRQDSWGRIKASQY